MLSWFSRILVPTASSTVRSKISERRFLLGRRKQTILLSSRLEQAEPCRYATSELGEKVLNERSEFRNLTLKSGRPGIDLCQ
jgi:hypothetical protein